MTRGLTTASQAAKRRVDASGLSPSPSCYKWIKRTPEVVVTGTTWVKRSFVFSAVVGVVWLLAGSGRATEPQLRQITAADCSYTANPDTYLSRESRARRDVFERTSKLSANMARAARDGTVDAASLPHRSFIDSEILGTLTERGVRSATLSTDEEFIRRIYLDLTGRIPTPEAIRAFVADTSSSKRDILIERLLWSSEFTDKWTMWLGDLVENTSSSSNISRGITARNAFFYFLQGAVGRDESLRDIACKLIDAYGNSFVNETGAASFPLGATTPMGPSQDTYDTMLVKTATAFLGMAHYDCILCHNGRRHLDTVSVWGKDAKRVDAQRMSAFFARMRLTRRNVATGDYFYGSYDVSDVASGSYNLNTNYGNRTVRAPVDNVSTLTPVYHFTGAVPAHKWWRTSFAENMATDPMLARNLANRIWKQLFNMGLVEPVDTLDPGRLDPANPPPSPWTLQATHPELLEMLAKLLAQQNFSLRAFVRELVRSSAYQLSTRYDGEWKIEYVPLFARHYPRRLDGEEVHDAIAAATGVMPAYTVQGFGDKYAWAMQLPDTAEPRSNSSAAAFLNVFLRGNRDTQKRSQAGSILQELYLMNDTFVLNRVRVSASPVLALIAKLPSDQAAVTELHYTFLGRAPSPPELRTSLDHLAKAKTAAMRNAAIEDLAWVLVNKVDFLFSY